MRKAGAETRLSALFAPFLKAALPLGRQAWLYLDPFPLFMDASRGSAAARRRAAVHNRRQRGILLAYLRRWLLIAGISFLALAPAEAAALAIVCCLALTAASCIGAAYLLLGASGEE